MSLFLLTFKPIKVFYMLNEIVELPIWDTYDL